MVTHINIHDTEGGEELISTVTINNLVEHACTSNVFVTNNNTIFNGKNYNITKNTINSTPNTYIYI